MNKHFNIIIFLFSFSSLFSQQISYGLVGNSSFKYLETKNEKPIHPAAGSQDVLFKIGAYGEYIFNNKLGVKLNFLFGNIKDKYHVGLERTTIATYESSVIEVDALFKYSINKSYNKGTYIILGGKIVFIEKNKNNEFDNPYNSSNLGIMIGLGKNIFRHFQIDLTAFQSVGKYLDIEQDNSYYSAQLNLSIDLESILNK